MCGHVSSFYIGGEALSESVGVYVSLAGPFTLLLRNNMLFGKKENTYKRLKYILSLQKQQKWRITIIYGTVFCKR
jgi:hypothetical protein